MKVIALISMSMVLSSCMLFMNESERVRAIAEQSNRKLCVKLLTVPSNVWNDYRERELSRRGEDCSQYVGHAMLAIERDRALRESLRSSSPTVVVPSPYDQAYPYAREPSVAQQIINNSSSPRVAPPVRSAVPNY